MRRSLLRTTAATVLALVLGAAAAGCGSDDGKAAPSASPSVAPYLDVPSGVQLTTPGTKLKIGQHAVIAWHPRQDTVAALDVRVRRLERTTFDKSFQGWAVTPSQAATTPYFARVTVKNVSDGDLGKLSVPLWGEDDAGRLVAAQPFSKRTFVPCHPAVLPKKFASGATAELCFVFLMSPGHDLASVAFQPQSQGNQFLQLVTWTGKATTKVLPPKPAKKKSAKTGGGNKAGGGKKKSSKAGR